MDWIKGKLKPESPMIIMGKSIDISGFIFPLSQSIDISILDTIFYRVRSSIYSEPLSNATDREIP